MVFLGPYLVVVQLQRPPMLKAWQLGQLVLGVWMVCPEASRVAVFALAALFMSLVIC